MALLAKAKQSIRRKRQLRAKIILDRGHNTFFPGEVVSGSCEIDCLQEIEFVEATISLEGTAFVEIIRPGEGARSAVFSSEEQMFLKQEQQFACDQKTPSKSTAKEEHRSMRFELEIPMTLNKACCHYIVDEVLQEEHRHLPPSLAIQGPDTVKIQYLINFTCWIRSVENPVAAQFVARRSITVVPIRLTLPITHSKDPRVKVSSLRSNFGVSKLGKIQVTAYQPPAIILNARKTNPSPSEATAVSLILEVTSKAGAEPPRLLNVKRDLLSLTFLSTMPWKSIPKTYPGLSLNARRGLVQKVFRLSEFKPSPVSWKLLNEDHLGKGGNEDEVIHMCHLTIPILPPIDLDIIPTFYSCLIARKYALKLSLSFHSQILLRSSISLEIPLDIIHQ